MSSDKKLIIGVDYGCTSTGPISYNLAEEGFVTYSWTKLILDPSVDPYEFQDEAFGTLTRSLIMQLPPGKQAQDVITTYLGKLNEHIKAYFRSEHVDLDNLSLEYWITTPATWSDKTKCLMRKAAMDAGLTAKPTDQIHLASEAEAAALTVFQGLGPTLQANDGLLVCDCGGGTVDVATYHVTDVQPQLYFEQLTAFQGGKCGGISVDARFWDLLRHQLGAALEALQSTYLGPSGKLLSGFQDIKSKYAGGPQEEYSISLPSAITASADPTFLDKKRHRLILNSARMAKLFEPVLSRISEFIVKQASAANRKFGRPIINKIVLTGGFSSSPYLRAQLREHVRQNLNAVVLPDPSLHPHECPLFSETVVSYGACLKGLTGVLPQTFKVYRHYGIASAVPFELNHRDVGQCLPDDPLQENFAPQWVLKKGQRYPVDFEKCVRVKLYHWEGGLPLKTIAICQSNDLDPPAVVTNPANQSLENMTCQYSGIGLDVFPSQILHSKKLHMLEANIRVQVDGNKRVVECTAVALGQEIGRTHFPLVRE